jgi:hypothetical protein
MTNNVPEPTHARILEAVSDIKGDIKVIHTMLGSNSARLDKMETDVSDLKATANKGRGALRASLVIGGFVSSFMLGLWWLFKELHSK